MISPVEFTTSSDEMCFRVDEKSIRLTCWSRLVPFCLDALLILHENEGVLISLLVVGDELCTKIGEI